ncbi:MAG: class II fructose-bisphosphate aldolase [Candidatus Paceibacterota bacterium]
MKTLQEALAWASEKKVAIGHFNVANIEALKAIFEAAQELSTEAGFKIPVIIGLSEGERKFVGEHAAVALIKHMRERYDYPIFLNADHTYDDEMAKEAVRAGYDSVIIDGANLSYDENLEKTKRFVEFARTQNPDCLVEAEVGYIGSGSNIKEALPEGAAITEDTVTKVDEAVRFVNKTGVDLLAPAVGNIHGMLKGAKNPNLIISRIKEIAEATGKPLVLHGGSGISDEDFSAAIEAGIRIVHISTELRRAYKEALDASLAASPSELAPYKIMAPVVDAMKAVVTARLKLFTNL